MKIVYNWLKEFVDVTAAPPELCARLSLSGTAVDSIEESAAGPVFDVEITANRPDCLGHFGMARETAAIYRVPVKPFAPELKETAEKAADATRVDIEAPELCGRYTARIMRGVKVQPSPDWLRERLAAIGQNSINNVVDVTNYVMFELGQPLHAFDLEKLQERRIVVRRARTGEKIRTLDGAERSLTKEMCVIADATRAAAIAGVMGGAETEIGFSSRNILIESAWFDPGSIRRTSKALGLRTEASYRFERGSDPEMAELASRRTAELIQQVAGGEILDGVVDVYPRREPAVEIKFTRAEFLRVMGADVPDNDIDEILRALGFRPVRSGANPGNAGSPAAAWRCERPSWRRDVTREIDLIEEVARHYGYDKFPARLPPAKQPAHRLLHAEAQDRLRERVIALGYQEIVEIPLVDPKRDEMFRAEGIQPAVIGNPLAEDASVMRSTGIVSMLGALEWNLNHGQRNLRLFEIGKTYELRGGEPVETVVLTLGATGLARSQGVWEQGRALTIHDLKGDLDRIGELAGGFAWQSGGPSWLVGASAARISIAPQNNDSSSSGNRLTSAASDNASRSEASWSGDRLGIAGQLARRLADQLKLRQEIFVAELRVEPLLQGVEAARTALRFVPLPRFPAVERDFSLLLSDGTMFARVADTIRALSIPEVQCIEAADLFRGGQIAEGKFSLMIHVTFQSNQATLTDAQMTDFSSRILAALDRGLGATLRTS
jgi:phenylalanyl-tRNA synthetase beta chain